MKTICHEKCLAKFAIKIVDVFKVKFKKKHGFFSYIYRYPYIE